MQIGREIEFKIKIRNYNNDDKIKQIFECYELTKSFEDIYLKDDNS